MDLMARRRAIMGIPSGKDYTVTGNVVSISNALAKNAKSLIVSFSPKQSGSGDPSPSNVRPITGYNDIGAVRYGKNYLSDLTRNSSGYSVTVKFTKDSVTLTGTASSSGGRNVFRSEYFSLSAGTYRFVRTNESDVKPSVYLQNGTSIISASSDGVFTLSADSTQMNIGLNVASGTTYDYHCSFVILASTDISPVTANVHVGGAGKNKLNPATTSLTNSTVFGLSATWSADGVLHFSGTWTGSKANSVRILDVDPAVRSLSVKGFSTGHVSLRWQNGEDRIVADFTSMTNGSTYDITVWPMVYAGTAPSVYEPYSLFGGTVDLVSGECVVDMGYIDLGTKNYIYRNSRFDATFSDGKLTLLNSGGAKAVASAYARSTNAYSSIPDLAFNFGSGYVNGSTCSIVVHDSRYTDATSFKSAVSGVMLCYELANPITYQLTPSQLALLKGNNTVYSNEGSISLTYVGK